jgi:hypothetical protein
VTAQAKTDAGSIRNAIRWGLLLAAVATGGFRLPRLVNYFRYWREAVRIGDSSAAEGWRTYLSVEATGLLIVLAIGLVVLYALRPRAKSEP